MGFLQGKKALITGVMSNRSIAYGIAQAFHREGAECIFTYVNDDFKDRVTKLVTPFNPAAVLPCDVTSDEQIEALFNNIKKTWGELDIIIHSLAFSPADQLQGDFLECVSREGFKIAHDVSAYSLCALAKAGLPLMKGRNGAIVSLSYLGAEKMVANYNTMGLAKASLEAANRYIAYSAGQYGVRANAISAGPIRTLAASGVKGLRKMLDYNEKVSPLKRNVTIEDVGNTAAFLASDLAMGVTGELIHVDCGYSTVGVPPLETLEA